MERNRLILLILGIFIAIFIGGTMMAILLFGEKERNRLAEIGDIDEELKKEYISEHTHKVGRITIKIIEITLIVGMLSLFTFATIAKINGSLFTINGQSAYVVRSGSMAKLNPNNPDYEKIKKYHNRFDVYDMVIVKNKPSDETTLQVGQIIMYKFNDHYIIHRLVQIIPPTPLTEHKYGYICSGDANSFRDKYVTYENIVGVYTDIKIPFVGVFVLWLQSSLGYVVVGIIIVYGIYSNYLSADSEKVRNKRLVEIGYLIPYISNNGSRYKVKFTLNDNAKKPEQNNQNSQVVLDKRLAIHTRNNRFENYNFNAPSKSKFKCTDYRYDIVESSNDKYVCVKATFKCQKKDISYYVFLHKKENADYIGLASKSVRYLMHSGKLDRYIERML